MIVSVAAGFGCGLVWFLVLSVLEGARAQAIGHRAETPYALLALAGAVSVVVVVLLVRTRRGFGLGMVTGLVACFVIGLIDVPYVGTSIGEPLLAIPAAFTRGSASVSAWVALGVAGALTAFRWRFPAPVEHGPGS